ncbi:hypothetical protein HBA55_30975 [Pseudomaricurvus alkylphenolicus]|uniref:hypothetical protein n=1 Tax=Pseudomaricurvus alkylphenolicus TaxID=1306991 RepID=UPI001423036D|nr:hypothetical protein [Pseudomaricurvus alkylphenolicus]NIB44064.1 hypothetical protein [Pseudomaricurvus alkylphenolicus]
MTKDRDVGVRIRLDARVPLESMVLNRLQNLPRARRDEWLRRLLILGFRSECHSLKSSITSERSAPRALSPIVTKDKNHNARVTPIRESPGVNPTEKAALWEADDNTDVPQPMAEDLDSKPFARLRAVMG